MLGASLRGRLAAAAPLVVLAALLSGLTVGSAGCARDGATLRWVDEWRAAERVFERGDLEEALARLEEVQQHAPAPADHAMIDLRQAKGLIRLGRLSEAFRALERIGRRAMHEQDRARARYEQARLLEHAGLRRLARPWYRRVVVVYPDLMPGMQGLQHLQRMAEADGPAAVEAHLQWSKAAYQRSLHATTIGDNVIYYAARLAYARWIEHGRDADRENARRLLLLIHDNHYLSGLWDDALWTLSHMARRDRLWHQEIDWIRRIQATREVATFVGSYESPYYWVGQLRIARRQMRELADHEGAVESYAWFLREYRKSRWRDDALFWQGCALLRLGRSADAEEAFSRIPLAYSESKYLRRLDAARQAPDSAICEPKVFEEADW